MERHRWWFGGVREPGNAGGANVFQVWHFFHGNHQKAAVDLPSETQITFFFDKADLTG